MRPRRLIHNGDASELALFLCSEFVVVLIILAIGVWA
jgi:hypothetical protein